MGEVMLPMHAAQELLFPASWDNFHRPDICYTYQE